MRDATTGASPHTRGWTVVHVAVGADVRGFPAHAGMDPGDGRTASPGRWLPRTRGDGPGRYLTGTMTATASPHTRGWTATKTIVEGTGAGFPAHAGMDPCGPVSRSGCLWLPRTRGDGPSLSRSGSASRTASPHTRGWTRWSARRAPGSRGFPAHAGMDPTTTRRTARSPGLPRTRGDGPDERPGRVGHGAASRTTRGWTQSSTSPRSTPAGFPAHAGMDRGGWSRDGCRHGLPRTRGDGPHSRASSPTTRRASPHTRGWTQVMPEQRHRAEGFPAHAGMDLIRAA